MQISSMMFPDEPNIAVIRRIFRVKNNTVPKFENRTTTYSMPYIHNTPLSNVGIDLLNYSNVKKSLFRSLNRAKTIFNTNSFSTLI